MREVSGREFMWSEHLGYLCTCPSNVGTGLEASVTIQLPQLSKVWYSSVSCLGYDTAPSEVKGIRSCSLGCRRYDASANTCRFDIVTDNAWVFLSAPEV